MTVGNKSHPFALHNRSSHPLHSPRLPSEPNDTDLSGRSDRSVLSGFTVGPSKLSDVVEIYLDGERDDALHVWPIAVTMTLSSR